MVRDGKHNYSRYVQGCRCAVCTAAAREAKQRQRARQKPHSLPESLRPAKQAPAKVVAMPTNPQRAADSEMGLNECSVRAECEQSRYAEDRPSVAAQAITLAKILDNDELAAMWPATSRQLAALMKELQGPKRKSNRLATVSAMSNRNRSAI